MEYNINRLGSGQGQLPSYYDFLEVGDEVLFLSASSEVSMEEIKTSIDYLDRTPEEIVDAFDQYSHMNVTIAEESP